MMISIGFGTLESEHTFWKSLGQDEELEGQG